MESERRWVETTPETAELARLYCFLRQITVKEFVTKTLTEALAPHESWIAGLRKLREEPKD